MKVVGMGTSKSLDDLGWQEIAMLRARSRVRHGFGISWVALVTPSGREILVEGLAIPMPVEFIDEVRARKCTGFTVGHAVAAKLGGDHRDSYVTITKGAITRIDTFKPAVLAAVLMARDEITR